MCQLNCQHDHTWQQWRAKVPRVRVAVLLVCCLFVILPPLVEGDVFRMFVDPSGNSTVAAMAEFRGVLFVATSGNAKPNRLYRAGLCGPPIEIAIPSPGSGRPGLAVFNDVLVLASGGSVLKSPDGKTWSSTGWMGTEATSNFVTFKGQLYVASYGAIYRTSTMLSWEKAATLPMTSAVSKVERLAVFGDFLYAGVGLDSGNGIQIYESWNGLTWRMDLELRPPIPQPGVIEPFVLSHVHGLTAFLGSVYAGEYESLEQPGLRVKRGPFSLACSGTTTSSGQSIDSCELNGQWKYESPGGPVNAAAGSVRALEAHRGVLYLGLFAFAPLPTGTAFLHYSEDGSNWNAVTETRWGGAVNGITTLAAGQWFLYVGTESKNGAGEIYAYAGPKAWVSYGCIPAP